MTDAAWEKQATDIVVGRVSAVYRNDVQTEREPGQPARARANELLRPAMSTWEAARGSIPASPE